MTKAREKANITQKVTTSEPAVLTDGMIWLDTDAVSTGQQNLRWTKTPSGGTTTLTGTDDNSITLTYTVGQETVYANGVLLIRGSDYTASTGTSIVLASASVAGDVFEVISVIPLSLVDTYTQAQADAKYVNNTLADAKGDLVVGTADNVISKIAVGSNGQSLIADSTTTSGLRWQDNVVAGKNLIINGNFDIWQRGTSFASTNGYFADRWTNGAEQNAVTASRQTSGAPNGSQYYLRLTSTGAGSYWTSTQYIETTNVSQYWGKSVAVSVKMRRNATVSNSGFNVYLEKSATVDAGPGSAWSPITNASALVPNSSIPTGTTSSDWYTATFTTTIPNDGTANSLRLYVNYNGGTANGSIFEFTQVQLEVGSVATHFSRAGGTIQGELAACQRYYYRSGTNAGGAAGFPAFGATQSTTSAYFYMPIPVQMRANPTSMDYANVRIVNYGTAAYGITSMTLDSASTTQSVGVFTADGATGMTANRPVFLYGVGVNNYVGFNAEL